MRILLPILAVTVTLYSCSNNNPVTQPATPPSTVDSNGLRNKKVALRILEGYGKRNLDSIQRSEDFDKNFVDYGDGTTAPIKGIDSTKTALKNWLEAFPDYAGSNFIAVSENNYVMVYAEWNGTWKNPLNGKKPTGKAFKINDVDIFKFNEEGKITEHRDIQPFLSTAMQIGMGMK